MSDRLDRMLKKKEENQKTIDRIQESIDDSDELTDWETDFLDSIKERAEKGWHLSDATWEKLEQIELIRAEGRQAAWDD